MPTRPCAFGGASPPHFDVVAAPTTVRESKSSQLDVADLRIIDALVANGRANARSMTSSTGLSEESVAGRVRGLIDRKIIGIGAILDWRAAGFHWDLFLSIRADSAGAGAVIDELALRDDVISV